LAGKQAKVLTDAQVKTLLRHIEDSRYPVRNRVIALLSIKAGLRAKEIAGLRWSHLTDPEGNLADELIIDDRTAKGKNGGRTIPINKDLKKALAELKDVIPSERKRPGNPPYLKARYSARVPVR